MRSFDLPGLATSTLVRGPRSALLLDTTTSGDGTITCSLQAIDLEAKRSGFLLTFACHGRFQAKPADRDNDWFVTWSRGYPPPLVSKEPIAVARYRANSASWFDGPRTLSIPLTTSNLDSLAVVGSDVWLSLDHTNVQKISGFAALPGPDVARVDAFLPDEISTFPLPGDASLFGRLWPLPDGVLAVRRRSLGVQVAAIRSDGEQREPAYIEATIPSIPNVARLSERGASAPCLAGPSGVSVTLVSDVGASLGVPIVVDEDAQAEACDLAWSGEELLVAWRHAAGADADHASVVAKLITIP